MGLGRGTAKGRGEERETQAFTHEKSKRAFLHRKDLALELGPGAIVMQRARDLGPLWEERHIFGVRDDATPRDTAFREELEPIGLVAEGRVKMWLLDLGVGAGSALMERTR